MKSPDTRVQLAGPGDLLAVIPLLLGFHPQDSLVIVAVHGPQHRVRLALRYDLPDPPDRDTAAGITSHITGVLNREDITTVLVAGYGPGTLVTPLADRIRPALEEAGITLHDLLRIEDGRYWSYLCTDPACCPPEGLPLDPASPAAASLQAQGATAAPSRSALAATIAPVTGPEAEAMKRATARAEHAAMRQFHDGGKAAWYEAGRKSVIRFVTTYRDGRAVTSPARIARLTVALAALPVRDDAWARMTPGHRDAHLRLWTDVTRHAQPGYVPAPASLLAFCAWQSGDGALATIALQRALDDDPEYSMALLLLDALRAGIPPSAAVLNMTPEEVAASYHDRQHS
jgi:hypothetical protein